MTYTATLTSKGQITIPAKILKEKNLKKGQKLIFHSENGRIYIETTVDMINRLSGSFPMPQKFKGMDIDKIIKISKEEHYKNRIKQKGYLL